MSWSSTLVEETNHPESSSDHAVVEETNHLEMRAMGFKDREISGMLPIGDDSPISGGLNGDDSPIGYIAWYVDWCLLIILVSAQNHINMIVL